MSGYGRNIYHVRAGQGEGDGGASVIKTKHAQLTCRLHDGQVACATSTTSKGVFFLKKPGPARTNLTCRRDELLKQIKSLQP